MATQYSGLLEGQAVDPSIKTKKDWDDRHGKALLNGHFDGRSCTNSKTVFLIIVEERWNSLTARS